MYYSSTLSKENGVINVLINAYACSPGMGSEPGMAWNWCVYLAKHCKLHIITEGEFKDKIEEFLPLIPYNENLKFYYLPVSENVRKMCWNQGDWRFYLHYGAWQKRALRLALEVMQTNRIDVVHQLNMIGFREPGFLWQIPNVPFVWGPINAKEGVSLKYLAGAGIRNLLFIGLKNMITRLQLAYSPRVKRAVDRAAFIVAASTDSANAIKKFHKRVPVLINEAGCEVSTFDNNLREFYNSTLNVLWIGRFILTKQLILAFETIKVLKKLDIKLHIVGGSTSEEEEWKQRAFKLGISEKLVWYGKVPREHVQLLMLKNHLLFFSSIAEGTPHAVLEAINAHLPVLCFETCGQGDVVTSDVGIKIPLNTPKESVRLFSEKLSFLYHNRNVLIRMSANCIERKKVLTWDSKGELMLGLYNKCANSGSGFN